MANPKNMRIGVVMHGYPPPPDLSREQRLEWLLQRAAELGLGALHIQGVENSPDRIRCVREQAGAADIELELGAPGVFGLVGPDAVESHARLLGAMAVAR